MSWRTILFTTFGLMVGLGIGYLVSFEHWTIPIDDPALSASVEPILRAGDVVVLWTRSPMDRGDLVRCIDPGDPHAFVVGRIMGKAGDEVKIERDGIRVGADVISPMGPCEPPTRAALDPGSGEIHDVDCFVEITGSRVHLVLEAQRASAAQATATVEDGKLFLVSDNRSAHLDSRDFGQVERSTCMRFFARLGGDSREGESSRGMAMIP